MKVAQVPTSFSVESIGMVLDAPGGLSSFIDSLFVLGIVASVFFGANALILKKVLSQKFVWIFLWVETIFLLLEITYISWVTSLTGPVSMISPGERNLIILGMFILFAAIVSAAVFFFQKAAGWPRILIVLSHVTTIYLIWSVVYGMRFWFGLSQ